MRPIRPFLPLSAAAFLALAAATAYPLDSAVDLRNDGSMSVSVPLGTDNGVTANSDFEVVPGDSAAVAIYPVELYGRRFWSQPLSEEEYGRIREGMPVRSVSPDPGDRVKVRAQGQKRLEEIRAKREAARKEAVRRDIGDLQKRRAALEDQRDVLEDRIAQAERDLADEEERMEWVATGEERDIDRSLETVLELADRRDELQERRLALSGQRPLPADEIDRLSAEIRRLNDRIDSERGRIRTARDRKRSARYSFITRRQEWRKLVAERNRVDGEIQSVERKIRDLADSLR